MRFGVLLGLLVVLALPARAQDFALVLVNDDYITAPDLRGLDAALDVVPALERAGFQVVSGRSLGVDDMRTQLAGFDSLIRSDGADRVVIVLAGHFAQSRTGAWLLGADAATPGLTRADSAGLRMDTLGEIAAQAGEGALIWLVPTTTRTDFGAGLDMGLPPRLTPPQGVGIIRGPVADVVAGLRAVLRPGALVADVVDRNTRLTGEGTISPLVPFLPVGFAPVARADRAAWADALADGTEAGFEAYLAAYPNGLNAQDARNRIAALRNTPERVEQALALTRDERRAIQRDLTTLGFSTRGVDGLFGPASRAAIRSWQTQNAAEATGFLTRDQIFALAGQSARRAAEIESEERAKREAAEAADRAFWNATGAGADEAGLRAYLGRYPRGIFATLARERLAQIEQAARDARDARDRADWDTARLRDTVTSYEAYLTLWPEGLFVREARARLAALAPQPPAPSPDPDPALAQAQAEEAALALPAATLVLVERRLARMGLDVGPVDGVLDDQTRLAIAQAQVAFNLPVTGYLTADLLNLMLTDVLRGLFE
jgi:peptidoglycan hydrolase-like protein with peptidoglycan-binding domain